MLNKIRNYFKYLNAFLTGNELTQLAIFYKSDKWGQHYYTPHYTTHFKRFRFKRINLFEIGVGGYSDPRAGGASLRMWKKYFPFGKIFSIDIYNKSPLEERRIKIFKGSQIDLEFLKNVIEEIQEPDIIIDDGSHINHHVIETFKFLFPLLKNGGIYVVEDTQTSYWPELGGDSTNLENPNTLMNFFKKLADSLNYKEIPNPSYMPSYFDRNIISIHFYHNLIFIYKGRNNEESNVVRRNKT